MTPTATPPRRVRWSWNAVILAWLGFYLALGVRSLVLDDARYGWGMFSKQVDYRIDYFWVLDDGLTRPMEVRADLKGEARKCLADGREHRTRYGSGMVRHAVGSYLRHRMTRLEPAPVSELRPSNAVAAAATITYGINHSKELHVEQILHPVAATP